jgi:tripartite-type tricarboxylate transporter receptor subunit TctC
MTEVAQKLIAAAVSIGTLVAACPAGAQSVEQFYRSHTVTLYVPSGTGGVNDLSARLVAKHLPRFLAGAPKIVVENAPGAGGLTLANRLFNTLPRDGTVLSVLERGTPQSAIAGDPAVKFDPRTLTWLGSVSSYAGDAYLLEVSAGFPARTLADLQKPDGPVAKLGTSGPGATNRTIPLIARELFGLHLRLVRGYTGAPNIMLAQERGEIDGQITSLSFMKTNRLAQWNAGKYHALLAFGRTTRLKELPDLPIARELVHKPADMALLEFAELPFHVAMPIVAPPGLPPDRAQALVESFGKMIKDPQFLAEGRALHLEMSPIDGAAVTDLIAKATRTPADVIKRYNRLVSSGP